MAKFQLTRMIAAAAMAAAAFLAGPLAGQATAQPATQVQLMAHVTGTPAQEYAACAAVYHYHHVNADEYGNRALWESAWHRAWDVARDADPAMRRDIDRYLFTDRGWSLVRYDCNPDEGL